MKEREELISKANMSLDIDKKVFDGRSAEEEDRFHKLLVESAFGIDDDGLYHVTSKGVEKIANFSNVEYLYNKFIGNQKIRVIKIGKTVFELSPRHLVDLKEFRKLLLSSNYNLTCSNREFNRLVNIIISLDNDKIITDTAGYGKVAENVYNFGNKILANNELVDYQSTIWLGKKGYSIAKTDMLHLPEGPLDFTEIWRTFYTLYDMQAVLIIGFAVATLFFQEYMNKEKKFPLLYIKAGSGRGKTGLTELIENLFGIKHPFSSVNCAGNSTKIGIESKSILLNNLPLILNELTEKEFQFIKSRYDGQGSVKYSEFKPGNISERSVNGSTIITTVVEPRDKQVISRCVFIDLDIIEMNKAAFEEARILSKKFASFTANVIRRITFTDIIKQIELCKKAIHCSDIQPRISDNYSIIGGCFQAFAILMPNAQKLPDYDNFRDLLIHEMKTTENYLNPLIYFLRELERLAECKSSEKYIIQDDKFLYFNFNGVWSLMSQGYKDKYFPFITTSYIKNLLKNSKYIARYGKDFKANANNPAGNPVCNFPKHIKDTTRKCFVLIKENLPGYYR